MSLGVDRPDPLLRELERAIRRRRLARARELAGRALGLDRKPPELFKLVGLLALLEDDLGRAAENLRRAHRLLPNDPLVLDGLGYLSLRRGRFAEAVDYWLRSLDLAPDNPVASSLLARLRKTKDLEKLAATCPPSCLFPSPLTLRLPSLPNIGLPPTALIPIGLLILLLPLLPQLTALLSRHSRWPQPLPPRPPASAFRLPEGDLVATDRVSRFTFLPEDIRGLMRQAKLDLRRRDHNAVIITVNRILLSNASDEVKARFRMLLDFLPEPSSPEEVLRRVNPAEYYNQPELYQGTWVVADGKVSRVRKDSGATSFLLRTPEYGHDPLGPWTYQVRMAGTYDLKDGDDIRLLARFENVLPLRGHIIVEGRKLWFPKTEFIEAGGRR